MYRFSKVISQCVWFVHIRRGLVDHTDVTFFVFAADCYASRANIVLEQ